MMKYIANLSRDELNNNVVILCKNNDDFPCVLVKNSTEKTQLSSFSTDNLEFRMNTLLECDNEKYYFHIIRSKKSDFISNQQFLIIYNYVFKKISNSIDETELYSLIDSIQEYFRITTDPEKYKMQLGVFGELLSIKMLYENGYKNVINKYHKNFYSKHDIEISDKLRIEIKSSSGEKRIHHFKHDQIFREDIEVYVMSSILEPSQEGYSLYEMFNDVMDIYESADSIFALQKLMKKCGVSEQEKGLQFALEKAKKDLKCFNAADLPKIEGKTPDGVTNISYDVDCSFAQEIHINDLIERLLSQ